jgi:hypothetical protein
MKGKSVISALKKKFKVSTDRALATRLGITGMAIGNWKKRKTITERQVAGLVHSACGSGAREMQANAIRPVVEFFHINKCPTKLGSKCELFSTVTEEGEEHPYWAGLQDELKSHHGVYIFFDSRGHAIYVGKARQLNLWREMNNAFNRKRGDVQKIMRVTHPKRKQDYRTVDEKARQITDHPVPLHELAEYFSAYDVADGMINEVEAMLVRSFANDLLNTRMEKFGATKRKKKSA